MGFKDEGVVTGLGGIFKLVFGWDPVEYPNVFENKVVLITGAGGSIGSQLTEQIATLGPEQIIILDHSEANLFKTFDYLRTQELEHITEPILCDIRSNQLWEVLRAYKPDIVLHAAAIKHVAMVEAPHNMFEALSTNVFGTRNALKAAITANPQVQFLAISTDKAVNPSSYMGLTKRVAEMELALQAQRYSEASIGIVRFGNVYGSSGSAVPIFEQQIEEGGPVTITDTQMTRYMMTIPQAVALVLSSVAKMVPGKPQLHVLDMQRVRIADLAEMLIRLSGKRVETKVIGIRPGEKLHEELFYPYEKKRASLSDGVWSQDFLLPQGVTEFNLDRLRDALVDRSSDRVSKCLKDMVPTFSGRVGL